MDKLYSLQIESSTACQAKCTFCPTGLGTIKRPKGQMSDELFHKIVAEGMEMGVEEWLLFKDGEPLIFKRFFEWMDYLAERHLQTALFTNAAQLTREKAERLASYTNLKFVMCSVHGGDKASYEAMMGLNYEQTRANVEYFISLPKSYRVDVYMLETPETHASVPEFLRTWGVRSFVSPAYYNWGGEIENPNKAHEGKQVPCGRILNQMQVLWDGRVALCCMDAHGEVILGDLNTETVRDVWERMKPLRDRHLAYDFDMPLCRDCNLNRFR